MKKFNDRIPKKKKAIASEYYSDILGAMIIAYGKQMIRQGKEKRDGNFVFGCVQPNETKPLTDKERKKAYKEGEKIASEALKGLCEIPEKYDPENYGGAHSINDPSDIEGKDK